MAGVGASDRRLLIWKEFEVGFGGASNLKSATAGERHDAAGAARRNRLFAEAPVGVARNLSLSFPDRGLHARCVERRRNRSIDPVGGSSMLSPSGR
jgi:hypothetical protein